MKKYILIILIALFTVSCGTGWLDLYPHNYTDEDNTILTITDAERALNGVYRGMFTQYVYGRDLFVLGDVGCEGLVLRTDHSNRYISNYRWELQTNTAVDTWAALYIVVDRANQLLEKLALVPKGAEANEKQRNQINGECYFARALIHFEITKLFAQDYNFTADASHSGAIYMTKSTKTDNNKARETMAKTFEMIISDCNEALKLMNQDKTATPYNAGSFAVKALLARVYLYMAGPNNGAYYKKAKDYAEEVIASNEYRLSTAEDYKILGEGTSSFPFSSKIWGQNYSYESIFTISFSDKASERLRVNSLASMYLDNTKTSVYGDFFPSQQLINLIAEDADDARNSLFYDVYDKGDKVGHRKWFGDGYSNWDISDIDIIRISEMYLIAAEGWAKATDKDETKALSRLNNIRTNRNAATFSSLTGAALIDKIILERRMELCFEGFGMYDHKRLQTDIVRTSDPINPENQKLGLEYPDKQFCFGIPDIEISVNELAKQNDGY